jgi:hypothetical protein
LTCASCAHVKTKLPTREICLLFDLNYGRGLPYDLREGISLNESSFCVLESCWNTRGAQEFPFGVVIVNETSIGVVKDNSNVINLGGSQPDHEIICLLTD